MKFAVIGDTHFCLNEDKTIYDEHGNIKDSILYSSSRKNLYRIAEIIKQENVDFLISTGDMIEGKYDDDAEFAAANELFSSVAPEFHLVAGTHDNKSGSRFKTFEFDNCRFILLDYVPRNWNEEQKKLLIDALEASKNAKRVFIFAHPPLYPWGREAFDSPWFRQDIEEIIKNYDVDLYFCGHTHNQVLSTHAKNLIQITASTVGPDTEKIEPLSRFHALKSKTPFDKILFGISEWSAPGCWFIELNGENLSITWQSLYSKSLALQTKRFGELELVSIPPIPVDEHCLKPIDKLQIRAGFLNIYSSEKTAQSHAEIKINNCLIGNLPNNFTCAARRFLPLSEAALLSIKNENILTIEGLGNNSVIMSASLTLLLSDNRVIHSHPMDKMFICGEDSNFEFIKDEAIKIEPQTTITTTLTFDKE
jgi:predicted phosphodiesterase